MIVENLRARTGCEGEAIYLSWKLPEGAGDVKILRRANDWNFYQDDPADLVYEGPAISSLDDVPGKPWFPLAGDTFYYYTVLAKASLDSTYELDALSRVFALSIEKLTGRQWIWDKVPKDMRRRDAEPKDLGGGGGDLEKWVTVMGCWLNLLRGNNKSILLNADPSKEPYPLALERSRSWGVQPDGQSYDFSVTRKFNERAAHIVRIRGTCPSLIEVAKVYAGWDATCIDSADTVESPGCRGPKVLATYDGKSPFAILEGEPGALQADIGLR